jgi:L-aspartate oxidase
VFAARIGESLARELPAAEPAREEAPSSSGLLDPAGRDRVTATMSEHVGALRSGAGLATATGELGDLAAGLGPVRPGVQSWEATDLLTVAAALSAAAAAREETRGCHWREDHPETDDDWRVHLDVRLSADGALDAERRPVGVPGGGSW